MSKRLKKWLGIAIALTMVMAMGITAAAKDSPIASGVVNEISSAFDADGCQIELKIQEVPEEYQAAVDELKSVDNLKSIIGSAYVEGMEVIDVKDLEIISIGDQSVEEHSQAHNIFPATITFEVPGVLPSTNVVVLCYSKSEARWYAIPCTAGNGTITATFEELSLVAFVVDKNTASGSIGSGTTSPKTGENMAIPFAGAAAVILLAAAGFCFRKREAR